SISCYICFSSVIAYPELLSFPTRRSSDLRRAPTIAACPSSDGSGGVKARPWSRRCCRCCRRLHDDVVGNGRERLRTILVRGKRRSEEHTSELQSRGHLVCRLLLEKKKLAV